MPPKIPESNEIAYSKLMKHQHINFPNLCHTDSGIINHEHGIAA